MDAQGCYWMRAVIEGEGKGSERQREIVERPSKQELLTKPIQRSTY